jgi:hypothetical protein
MKTQNRALYKEASATLGDVTLTDSVIGSLPNESSSVCPAHPWYVPTRHPQKFHAHLISLHNEHHISLINICNKQLSVLIN